MAVIILCDSGGPKNGSLKQYLLFRFDWIEIVWQSGTYQMQKTFRVTRNMLTWGGTKVALSLAWNQCAVMSLFHLCFFTSADLNTVVRQGPQVGIPCRSHLSLPAVCVRSLIMKGGRLKGCFNISTVNWLSRYLVEAPGCAIFASGGEVPQLHVQ